MSFVYVLACRLFELVVLLVRCDSSKVLEILVLRHELAILRRQTRRPQFTPSDRFLQTALSRVPVGYANPSVMLLGRIRGSVRRVGRIAGVALAGSKRRDGDEALVSVVSARARDVAYGCCSDRRRCAGRARVACDC